MFDPAVQIDLFSTVQSRGSLQQRLASAHAMFNRRCPGVARIGVALFDNSNGQVRTFIASQEEANPLRNYQISLEKTESLASAARPGQARVINDLNLLAKNDREHSETILALGMRSSYTLPIYEREQLRGFVFLDSRQPGFFQAAVLTQVALFAQLLAEMVLNHQASIRSLLAALRVSLGMMHLKDPETGNHLARMARFARLIAQELIVQRQLELDDEQVDNLYRFAPLHDIGKVGIPDRILLKPGRLDAQEWSVMKGHSGIGRSIVDHLIREFDFDCLPDVELLRQIVELHHEKIDGSGYPHGLTGSAVPVAARIISISDIFDALTNERPYKKAWSNRAAFGELQQLVDLQQIDGNCVTALQNRLPEVVAIQQSFSDR